MINCLLINGFANIQYFTGSKQLLSAITNQNYVSYHCEYFYGCMNRGGLVSGCPPTGMAEFKVAKSTKVSLNMIFKRVRRNLPLKKKKKQGKCEKKKQGKCEKIFILYNLRPKWFQRSLNNNQYVWWLFTSTLLQKTDILTVFTGVT